MRLRDKFLDFVRRQKLFSKGDKVLIAVSGGPDSVALSYLLDGIKNLYRLKLYLVYVAHHWRSVKEINRDKTVVRQLAKDLKVPLIEGSLLCRPENEALARKYRYAFLRKVAKKLGIKKIATGHNCDDFAETVIFNLVRSGEPKGIPVRRKLKTDIEVVRPLLAITRREILDFLLRQGKNFVQDATNWQRKYPRNFIRAEIIPRLKEINERAVENIFRIVGKNGKGKKRFSFGEEESGVIELRRFFRYNKTNNEKRHFESPFD